MALGEQPGIGTGTIYRRNLLDPTFRYLGPWDGVTVYVPGDYVTNGGSSYVCTAQNVNNAPPNTNYWGLVGAGSLSAGSTGQVLIWNGTSWVGGLVANANVDSAAAIAYSKLNLTGGIVNADISASAAIAPSKLSGYPTDGTKFLAGDGTWKVAGGTPGTEIDYAEYTGGDATNVSIGGTAATAYTLITGNLVAYDGTAVIVEFQSPPTVFNSQSWNIFALYIDGTAYTTRGIVAYKSASTIGGISVFGSLKLTPAAGSHTLAVKVYNASGTASISIQDSTATLGGANVTTVPVGHMRVTKA
ncbi:MAG TPA: hypothetical protein VIY48_04140 [Candidatus Paceibacterota bacterium]